MVKKSPEVNNAENYPDNIPKISIHQEGDESILKTLRIKNLNRIILGHININSLRNKFDQLKEFVMGKIDILIISETKLDQTFPTGQFLMHGYSDPFRLDRTAHGGGILIFIREDIPSKLLTTHSIPKDIECILFEINLHGKKWLVCSGYNPHKHSIKKFLDHLSKALDTYFQLYDNIIIIGDFNCEETETHMSTFCENYILKNLVKEPTCYKNLEKPSCIDLILTNRNKSFINTSVVETGLSDHHKLILTVLKSNFIKLKPKTVEYRCYKNFNDTIFKSDLQKKLSKISTLSYNEFESRFLEVLDKHAPCKRKEIRGNESPFMTKALKKAIMKRTKTRNKYLKNNTLENKNDYKRMRNFCVSLVKKSKKEYYNNINTKNIIDNKKFWKTVKPMFSDKVKQTQNISLVENENIITDHKEVAQTFNQFFINVVPNLNITIPNYNITITDGITDKVEVAIKKYETHPSIIKIKYSIKTNKCFSFTHVTEEDVLSIVKSLDPAKSTTNKNIPIKILKSNIDVCIKELTSIFNNMIDTSIFPNNLKKADVTPVHKKGDRTMVSNYRPVSVLPTVSKIFEKLLSQQINSYIKMYLCDDLCGFREGFSSQHCLTVMIESIREVLDKGGIAGALLTDLSKAFDCIQHDLLIAKMHAYGFSLNSLHLMYNYLSDRKQRTKINSSFSDWVDIVFGVPQGSVLGPLFFNIQINDIFFFAKKSKITNFADDNTPFTCGKSTEEVIQNLLNDANLLMKWFDDNGLKLNEGKCKLLILSRRNIDVSIKIGNATIRNTNSEKLLGITIDSKLTFNEHVKNLCKKASQKLHALARIANYMSQEKLRIIMKAFVTSQFGYCPLVWMHHSRTLNARINKIHERALRLVYKDNSSTFNELLHKDLSVTIHEKNIKVLLTEMYRVENSLSPKIMNTIFPTRNICYPLRCARKYGTNLVKTTMYGTETIRFRGPRLWQKIPDKIKYSRSLNEFKSQIKNWHGLKCDCRLCKIYIQNIGFI